MNNYDRCFLSVVCIMSVTLFHLNTDLILFLLGLMLLMVFFV